MGLVKTRVEKRSAEKRTADDVLLFHAMMLMCGVDGEVSSDELKMLRSYLATLPDFQHTAFDSLVDESRQLAERHGGFLESIPALMDCSSEAIKRKCFILAADIALSKSRVNEAEDQLLETMQRLLEIDREVAEEIVDVLAMKYER